MENQKVDLLKEELWIIIEGFIEETKEYEQSEELNKALEGIYRLEDKLKTKEDIDIKSLYNQLIAKVTLIRYKFGFESKVFHDLNLDNYLDNVSLDLIDNREDYRFISAVYNVVLSSITNVNFFKFNKNQIPSGVEELPEMLNNLLGNINYRDSISNPEMNKILVDYIKIMTGVTKLDTITNGVEISR